MTTVVRFHEFGGPEVLRLEEHDLGDPGPGEVLIDVQAIGLNRSEVNFRLNRYLDKATALPSGLGYEGSGRVVALGEDVDGFAVGDEVSVLPVFRQSRYHMYGEQAIVPAHALVLRPNGIDAITGAAAWMPYLTVYGALIDIGRLRAGDHVVITAPTSSMGYSGFQTVARAGGVSIAVTENAGAVERLLALGADHVLVQGVDSVAESVRRITGGRGARIVFDAVAGPGVEELARAVEYDGILFIHGSLSGEPTPMPGLASLAAVWVRPYALFEVTGDAERFARAKQYVSSGLSSGQFRPVIDEVFDLNDIVEAHRRFESRGRFGKIVVTTGVH